MSALTVNGARRRPLAPLLAVVGAVALAVLVAACGTASVGGVVGPREWTQTLTRADGSTHTVVVRDASGRLTNVEFDPAGVGPVQGISNPPGAANVVLVPWAAGSCDVRTEIVFTAAGQGLNGASTTKTTGDVCDMMAIEHLLRLTSAAPLPANLVTYGVAP